MPGRMLGVVGGEGRGVGAGLDGDEEEWEIIT